VLEKRIPTRAGLGGGSSDAAAAWLGTLELALQLGLELDRNPRDSTLRAELGELGSDCAFFLTPTGYARCEGRGERVTSLELGPLRSERFAVVTPALVCPTGAVYAALELAGRRSRGDALWWNDLEPAALRAVPELADFRRKLEGTWLLAGSGASFFRRETSTPPSAFPEMIGNLAHVLSALRYRGAHRPRGSGAVLVSACVPQRGGRVPLLLEAAEEVV
jgi:4-diphosphocytidyl-2-C-methyl-D-erythritol kinase